MPPVHAWTRNLRGPHWASGPCWQGGKADQWTSGTSGPVDQWSQLGHTVGMLPGAGHAESLSGPARGCPELVKHAHLAEVGMHLSQQVLATTLWLAHPPTPLL